MASANPTTSTTVDPAFDRTLKAKGRIYARRLTLAKAVQKRKHILFGSPAMFADDTHTGSLNSQRRDAWEEVRQELLRKGYSEFAAKTRLDIQKTDWQHVRRYVMDKRKKDPFSKDEPITELDTVVFDIVHSFGRYSTRDNGPLEDNEEESQQTYANGSLSPDHHDQGFKIEENGSDTLPHFSKLLNFPFQHQPSASSTPETSADDRRRITETRLQREEYLTMQERIRSDIERERLIQERLKTQLLLAQLAKENPKMAEQFDASPPRD